MTILDPDAQPLASWDVGGGGQPDLGAVDLVARLVLLGRRLGHRVVVSEASPALRDLLELAALDVEVQGEPEGGEEALGV